MEKNYTYILECADKSLYCGWTNHLGERVAAHNAGRGAKYTKSRRPVTLVYFEEFATKQEAMRREWEVKRLSRSENSGVSPVLMYDSAERTSLPVRSSPRTSNSSAKLRRMSSEDCEVSKSFLLSE